MDTNECAQMLVNLQVRLLKRLRNKIDHRYLNKPIEDHTEEERGMEMGLGMCISDIEEAISELERPLPNTTAHRAYR